jgi:hypothetical protein
MHPEIRQFPSEFFYAGKLIDAPSVRDIMSISDDAHAPPSSRRVKYSAVSRVIEAISNRFVFLKRVSRADQRLERYSSELGKNISTRGSANVSLPGESEGSCCVSFFKRSNPDVFLRTMEFFDITTAREDRDGLNRKTLVNYQEALFIGHLCSLMEPCFEGYSVGVITPYEGQKRLIQKVFSDVGLKTRRSIEVNTVDGFQGREKDVIIISCVRSSTRSIGFLDDDRRMNVAITRAKRCLVVVGSAAALQASNGTWRRFVEHVAQRGCLTSFSLVNNIDVSESK